MKMKKKSSKDSTRDSFNNTSSTFVEPSFSKITFRKREREKLSDIDEVQDMQDSVDVIDEKIDQLTCQSELHKRKKKKKKNDRKVLSVGVHYESDISRTDGDKDKAVLDLYTEFESPQSNCLSNNSINSNSPVCNKKKKKKKNVSEDMLNVSPNSDQNHYGEPCEINNLNDSELAVRKKKGKHSSEYTSSDFTTSKSDVTELNYCMLDVPKKKRKHNFEDSPYKLSKGENYSNELELNSKDDGTHEILESSTAAKKNRKSDKHVVSCLNKTQEEKFLQERDNLEEIGYTNNSPKCKKEKPIGADQKRLIILNNLDQLVTSNTEPFDSPLLKNKKKKAKKLLDESTLSISDNSLLQNGRRDIEDLCTEFESPQPSCLYNSSINSNTSVCNNKKKKKKNVSEDMLNVSPDTDQNHGGKPCEVNKLNHLESAVPKKERKHSFEYMSCDFNTSKSDVTELNYCMSDVPKKKRKHNFEDSPYKLSKGEKYSKKLELNSKDDGTHEILESSTALKKNFKREDQGISTNEDELVFSNNSPTEQLTKKHKELCRISNTEVLLMGNNNNHNESKGSDLNFNSVEKTKNNKGSEMVVTEPSTFPLGPKSTDASLIEVLKVEASAKPKKQKPQNQKNKSRKQNLESNNIDDLRKCLLKNAWTSKEHKDLPLKSSKHKSDEEQNTKTEKKNKECVTTINRDFKNKSKKPHKKDVVEHLDSLRERLLKEAISSSKVPEDFSMRETAEKVNAETLRKRLLKEAIIETDKHFLPKRVKQKAKADKSIRVKDVSKERCKEKKKKIKNENLKNKSNDIDFLTNMLISKALEKAASSSTSHSSQENINLLESKINTKQRENKVVEIETTKCNTLERNDTTIKDQKSRQKLYVDKMKKALLNSALENINSGIKSQKKKSKKKDYNS